MGSDAPSQPAASSDVDDETPWSGRGAERFARVNAEHEHQKREFLAQFVPLGPAVLELGCGNQLLKAYLSNDYTGLDWEADFEPDVVADSTDVPLEDDHVPIVICKDHLVHVPDWQATIAEARRVASYRVVIMERSHTWRTVVLQEEPFHFQAFAVDDLQAALNPDDPDAVSSVPFRPSVEVPMREGSVHVLWVDVDEPGSD